MEITLTEAQKKRIQHPATLYPIMRDILLREELIDMNREHFWTVGLAANLKLQYVELVSFGGTLATTIEPMNVFRLAVQKGSIRIILVHNHPSSSLVPTDNDKDLTDQLYQVGRILDVQVDDHLIISTKDYYSFALSGMLKELSRSTNYVPPYELEKRYRAEKEAIVRKILKQQEGLLKQAREDEKTEIAKAALAEGMDIKLIQKITGLTKKKIEGLR